MAAAVQSLSVDPSTAVLTLVPAKSSVPPSKRAHTKRRKPRAVPFWSLEAQLLGSIKLMQNLIGRIRHGDCDWEMLRHCAFNLADKIPADEHRAAGMNEHLLKNKSWKGLDP